MPVHHLTDRTIAAHPMPSESGNATGITSCEALVSACRTAASALFVVRHRVGRRMRRLTIGRRREVDHRQRPRARCSGFGDSSAFVGVMYANSWRTSRGPATRRLWPIAPWASSAGCSISRSIVSGLKRIRHHRFPKYTRHALPCLALNDRLQPPRPLLKVVLLAR
jgi:hypothetical protein